METTHRVYFEPAQRMVALVDKSVDLVVTSPPYPMIAMWDNIMSQQNPAIADALAANNGNAAFALMHNELDTVWAEVCRIMKPGGFVCINIGDATRTLDGLFQLFSNHTRIVQFFVQQGFSCLPAILWRKPTNAPNKFMGSGMLPAGAYITLEHEYILVFRKGGKRVFRTELEKLYRQQSAFFWEERNQWFSDMWDIRGTQQRLLTTTSRERSGAYPFEIPHRLINMYSVRGDVVLDPFLGTGTTTLAAMAAGRNSIGYEVDTSFEDTFFETISESKADGLNAVIAERFRAHREFVEKREGAALPLKHFNKPHQMPVMTNQETELTLLFLESIIRQGTETKVQYAPRPTANPAFIRPTTTRKTGQQHIFSF